MMRILKRLCSFVLILAILMPSTSIVKANARTADCDKAVAPDDVSDEIISPEIISTIKDYYELTTHSSLKNKDIAQLCDNNLPSRVDNSESPYFPEIGDQLYSDSANAFAIVYYMFTYTMNKTRGVPTTPENTFSPKFVYNLTNGGVDDGSSLSQIYNVLHSIGCPTNATYPYDGRDELSWPDEPRIWREAISYRLMRCQEFSNIGDESTQITSPDDTDLLAIKTALNNGDVLRVSSHVDNWEYGRLETNQNVPENDKYDYDKYVSHVNGIDCEIESVVIVGYNDDIWCDINNNKQVDEGEMGAFKIAGSFGEGFGNFGYFWIAYDAFNKTSVVENADFDINRISDFFGIQRIETFKPYFESEIYVQMKLVTQDRTQFSVEFDGERFGQQYKGKFLKDINYQVDTNKLSFQGSNQTKTATFIYPLRDTIPSLSNSMFKDSEFYITIKDTIKDDVSLTVQDVTLVNEYTGERCRISEEFPLKLNGSEYSKRISPCALIKYTGYDNPTLHYKIGDGQFVDVPMKDCGADIGYINEYLIEDVSGEIKLYFSDEKGNIDDNNGLYYTAWVGDNYFKTPNVKDTLTIRDISFANGTADVGLTKRCLFETDICGGYGPYNIQYTIENLDTGSVASLRFNHDFETKPYYFLLEGRYKVTADVLDRAGNNVTLSKEFDIKNQPFEISSLVFNKAYGIVSQPIEFKCVTAFENIKKNTTLAPQMKFVIKDSSGASVFSETIDSTDYSALDATSTTILTYTPSKPGDYTLTVSSTDNNKEYAEKTIGFTVNNMMLGDTDGDGYISVIDATFISLYLADIITEDDIYTVLADCDEDSKVSVMDCTYLQQYVAEIDNGLNIGKLPSMY